MPNIAPTTNAASTTPVKVIELIKSYYDFLTERTDVNVTAVMSVVAAASEMAH